MKFFDVFHGDADGIFALHQLRLHQPRESDLITGAKRDINLLSRIRSAHGDSITVLDISMDSNRNDLVRILNSGANVEIFDHHNAGEIPDSRNLTAHLDDSPDTCTSLIVNTYLNQKYCKWAIAGAFGDNIVNSAMQKAAETSLSETQIDSLKNLGELFNYNSYGESISDLFFPPASLYRAIQPFEDPFDFIPNTDVVRTLQAGHKSDLDEAERLFPHSCAEWSRIYLLPDEPWARRVRGTFAYRLAKQFPDQAIAIVQQQTGGLFVVSVRTPVNSTIKAVDFCKQYDSGGGRASAAGINQLPEKQFRAFEIDFHRTFSVQNENRKAYHAN